MICITIKKCQNLDRTQFKTSCIKNWNKLSVNLKVLPCSSGNECLHRALKMLRNYNNDKNI